MLAYELSKKNIKYARQIGVPVVYDDIKMELGFRADLIVGDKVILELKSVESILPVHKKQLLTYNDVLGINLNFTEYKKLYPICDETN